MPLHPALRRYADPPDFPLVRYVLAGAACGFAGIALALGLLHIADTRTENARQARIEAQNTRESADAETAATLLTRVLVRDFDAIGFPAWVADHPTDDCPRSLSELEPYVHAGTSMDPWGTAFRFVCTRSGLRVDSAGPDRTFDTGDDIGSPR